MPDMSGRLLLISGRELDLAGHFVQQGSIHIECLTRKTRITTVINWENCPTGAQNVRQSAEGLPDILSGTPEIVFATTEHDTFSMVY